MSKRDKNSGSGRRPTLFDFAFTSGAKKPRTDEDKQSDEVEVGLGEKTLTGLAALYRDGCRLC